MSEGGLELIGNVPKANLARRLFPVVLALASNPEIDKYPAHRQN